MRRALAAGAVALALAALGACGGGSSQLSEEAARDLQAGVARVRAAAMAGDRAAAGHELAAVRSAVARYRSRGQVGDDRQATILAAVADVEAGLALLSPPATTTTREATTTTTRTPARDEEEGGEDGDGGKPKKAKGGKDEDD